jgi:hypothetical protein
LAVYLSTGGFLDEIDVENENPDSLAGEIGAGIETLQSRVERYGKAKSRALDVADFIRELAGMQVHAGVQVAATAQRSDRPSTDGDRAAYSRQRESRKALRVLGHRVANCGYYLEFSHYHTIDEVRLTKAYLCAKHLLCPLCAIRRGSKALGAYLERWEYIQPEKTSLKPFLVTLTVKDGDDLAERFEHLYKSQQELWKRKQRGLGSVLDGVDGAVWSYEVKRGANSGSWHPHLHMVALAESEPSQAALSKEWHDITGDSFIVDVRPISQADPVSGFIEVFKYAVKFSDQSSADTYHCFKVLGGRRLIGSAGVFRGVQIPQQLTDEPFDDLPFVRLFYRFIRGAYSQVTTA